MTTERKDEDYYLHLLWGRAKEHPDYNKAEWVGLQRAIEKLQHQVVVLEDKLKHARNTGDEG